MKNSAQDNIKDYIRKSVVFISIWICSGVCLSAYQTNNVAIALGAVAISALSMRFMR